MKPSRRSLGVVAAVGLGLLLAALLFLWASPSTGELDVARVRPVAPVVVAPPTVAPAPATRPAPAAPRREPVVVVQDDPATLAADRQWFAVDVVAPDGRPVQGATVLPIACEGFAYDPDQRLFFASPGDCVVQAIRRDGALFARSEHTAIALTADTPPGYLQIELPDVRTGGIGVRFMPTDAGMRVVEVVDGGPAWDAGLEIGDVIVSVNGEAVDGLGNMGFIERMTGPEGSQVEFEVRYIDPEAGGEAAIEKVQVERRFLEG